MKQLRIPAVFMRGGTSNAIVLHERDCCVTARCGMKSSSQRLAAPIRMGVSSMAWAAGISSLSKVCVVGPPTRSDADIDYTFAQVQVKEAKVDYSGNCGNMSSAMGPFAVDEGLIQASGREALVRVHNTNTKKIIHARFSLDEGLSFLSTATSNFRASQAVALQSNWNFANRAVRRPANCCRLGKCRGYARCCGRGKKYARHSWTLQTRAAFSTRRTWVLTGSQMRKRSTHRPSFLKTRENSHRRVDRDGHRQGRCGRSAQKGRALRWFCIRTAERAVTFRRHDPGRQCRSTGRMLSNGQPHRRLCLLVSLCMAVAARIRGSLVHVVTRRPENDDALIRIAMPSGVLVVAADVKNVNGAWHAEQGAFFRTQRRMFDECLCSRIARAGSCRGDRR